MFDLQRHAGLRPLSVLLFLLIATGVAGAGPGAAVQDDGGQEDNDAPAPETLELGREVYASQCMSCHGRQGEGDGPAARFLDVQPRDLTAGEWRYVEAGTVEAIAELIARGIPDTPMEPFEELLPEEEIEAVAAHVVHEIAVDREDDQEGR